MKHMTLAELHTALAMLAHQQGTMQAEIAALRAELAAMRPGKPDAIDKAKRRSIRSVHEAVIQASRETGIDADDIYSKSRRAEIVAARWRAMQIAHERGMSSVSIGRGLGMDHSTVLHGLRGARQ